MEKLGRLIDGLEIEVLGQDHERPHIVIVEGRFRGQTQKLSICNEDSNKTPADCFNEVRPALNGWAESIKKSSTNKV